MRENNIILSFSVGTNLLKVNLI